MLVTPRAGWQPSGRIWAAPWQLLRKYQVLFGVDGLLSDIHVACYSILDDIRLGIIGLENDPDSPYYSQEV